MTESQKLILEELERAFKKDVENLSLLDLLSLVYVYHKPYGGRHMVPNSVTAKALKAYNDKK